jgi:hypothetical protein
MRETCISLPPEVIFALTKRANDCGFYGRTALSSYIRHVVIETFDAKGTSPIIVQPTSAEQRQWFEDYAKLKNHQSVEAFALHAIGGMTKKVPLTNDEQIEYDKMVSLRTVKGNDGDIRD